MTSRKSFVFDQTMQVDLNTILEFRENKSAAIRFALARVAEIICAPRHDLKVIARDLKTGEMSLVPEHFPFNRTPSHALKIAALADEASQTSSRMSFVFDAKMQSELTLIQRTMRRETESDALRFALSLAADILCGRELHGLELKVQDKAVDEERIYDPHKPLFKRAANDTATSIAQISL